MSSFRHDETNVTHLMTKDVPKGFWQKRTDNLAENRFVYVKKKQYFCRRK